MYTIQGNRPLNPVTFIVLKTLHEIAAKEAVAGSTGHRNDSVLMSYSRRIICHE